MTQISITKGEGVSVFNAEEDLEALGVWKCISNTFTAVFPIGTEPDPQLVEECRRHDPKFVPVWCKKVFKTPAGTEEEYGHYVICREVPTDEVKGEWDAKYPIKLENWPRGFKFNPKAIYEVRSWTVPWPKGSPMIALGLPDIAKGFDSRLVEYVRQEAWAYENWTKAEWALWLQSFEEADKKVLKDLAEEMRYQVQQDFRKVDTEAGMGWKEVTPKPFVEVKGASE